MSSQDEYRSSYLITRQRDEENELDRGEADAAAVVLVSSQSSSEILRIHDGLAWDQIVELFGVAEAVIPIIERN